MTEAPTPPEDAPVAASRSAGPSPEAFGADGQPVDTSALDRAHEAIDEGHAAARAALGEDAAAGADTQFTGEAGSLGNGPVEDEMSASETTGTKAVVDEAVRDAPPPPG